MTYGRAHIASGFRNSKGADVSHLAELVRGDCISRAQGPLIRPFGAPSPQGEKGDQRSARPARVHVAET
jgi:hypothetical protein